MGDGRNPKRFSVMSPSHGKKRITKKSMTIGTNEIRKIKKENFVESTTDTISTNKKNWSNLKS